MIGWLRKKKRELEKWAISHKGVACEARALCFRKTAGSIVCVAEDDEDGEIGTMVLYVCEVHKQQALAAAENFTKNFELKYRQDKVNKSRKKEAKNVKSNRRRTKSTVA